MKRVIMLLILCTGLFGCSKSPEQREVEKNIRGYEAKIEEALLMDNGYQDSKFTNVREDLDEYLTSSRGEYEFEISSPYEGLTLDEALEYYNDKNGTSLTNLTKEEAPEIQEELEAIEENKKEQQKNSIERYKSCIYERQRKFHISKTSDDRLNLLKEIANYLVFCEGNCTSDLLSYEDAQKWVESDEYNIEWAYIDGEYVKTPPTPILDTTKGTCKEIEGKYTSQGLSIIDCSYNSSKDRISITVQNNSGADLKYIMIEIFGISSSGQTISSDFTNHGSTIRNGAMQTLERYVDYAHSYEVEITEARMKY